MGHEATEENPKLRKRKMQNLLFTESAFAKPGTFVNTAIYRYFRFTAKRFMCKYGQTVEPKKKCVQTNDHKTVITNSLASIIQVAQ